jgi:hypothetical protein
MLFHCGDFAIVKAVHGVVNDHANGLHGSVTNGGINEPEALLEQVFAQLARQLGFAGYLSQCAPDILNGLRIDKAPQITAKLPNSSWMSRNFAHC